MRGNRDEVLVLVSAIVLMHRAKTLLCPQRPIIAGSCVNSKVLVANLGGAGGKWWGVLRLGGEGWRWGFVRGG